MNNHIEDWVNQWSIISGDESFRTINAQINFFAEELYVDYQPAQNQAVSFRARLENWLLNVPNEKDKMTLFKLLPHLFYVGAREFTALYRVAYNEIVASWLIDIDGISFNNLRLAQEELRRSIKNCWICPITDSFNINTFFHVNNIPNNGWNERRPQWYGIERHEDNGRLWESHLRYINQNNINKLIILEDFVGSGSQIEGAVDFIMNKGLNLDVLLIPLIICPEGVTRFSALSAKHDRLTYKAVIELSNNCFIKRFPSDEDHVDFEEIRELIQRIYTLTSGGLPEGNNKPYSPFGWRQTGGLVVMNSNTPDNTLPSIHWSSNTWIPIFPRHSRN